MKKVSFYWLYLNCLSLCIFKLPDDGSQQNPKHVANNKAV